MTSDAEPRISSVLFMCGMNSIRSPMAAAIASRVMPRGVYVASAGVNAGENDPFVDVVLKENGLDLGSHKPHLFEDLEDGYFDLVVTMAPEAHHLALDTMGSTYSDVEFWPMPDPSLATGTREQVLDAYRDLFRRIETRLIERFG
ncbi:low molecular weight phosphatase family protein [Fulvimarina endophytica]|uniref:Low molecular weight phosphatase family protein n=1 Tax=Fulvimarina endophytica TaxID=2293836 RepID=A0A371WY67_9HYPH|nr:low molecular weight phosphatase family protein [Fulvimarina endophytica]RFC61937.1 low molecular weight phosphatase family protein [Fulvimarina endophytica]